MSTTWTKRENIISTWTKNRLWWAYLMNNDWEYIVTKDWKRIIVKVPWWDLRLSDWTPRPQI
jgi:hypothetical protein